MCVILLFGTAVFSFIMGNFISIILSYKDVTAENEDSQGLTSFFALIAKFNKGRPLPKEMTRNIEAYFEYYWKNDKNYAIQSEEDKRYLKELPKSIRRSVSIMINSRFSKISCSRSSCTASSTSS